MAGAGSIQRALLDEGVQKIQAVLRGRGFEYSTGDQGVSSGGSFAVAFFRRADLTLGLIVRHSYGLGSPGYSIGGRGASHGRLIVALGHSGEEHLVETRLFSSRARDGGDVFEALRWDLEHIILPVLDQSPSEFREALARAAKEVREELGLED